MNADIHIRPIRPEDAVGFRYALDSVAKEQRHLASTEAPPLAKVQAFVDDNCTQGYPQYIATNTRAPAGSPEAVIGWADIIPHHHPSAQHVGKLGMGIIAAYRGQGIGSSLLAQGIASAWDYGLQRLELEVFSENTAAIQLYRKHGYIPEGTKRYACCVAGRYYDTLLMAQYRLPAKG